MKVNFIKSFIVGTAVLLAVSCANDDNYNSPVNEAACTEPAITADYSVASLATAATTTPRLFPVSVAGTPDSYIEGYVTSSDERGTFFKAVSLQTRPTDGSESVGFSITIDANGLFGKGFKPGRKIYIKLNGLYYAKEYGSLKIGALYQNTTVGRIAEKDYKKNIFFGCAQNDISEEDLVIHTTIDEALQDKYINKLIELDSVQFNQVSFGYTLYDKSAPTANGNPQTIGGATNHNLEDKFGNKIVFRTSSFANFAGQKVSTGTLKVRGVLTKYCSSTCTYQFIPRFETDIKEIGRGRLVPESNLTFSGSYLEDFESYAVGATTFPNYINNFSLGSRYWQLKQFPTGTGNKFIEMTSFAGSTSPGVPAKSYFFAPVDFTSANTLTFKKEIRFMAGQALKVYYVRLQDYPPGGDINVSLFTDITSSFTGLTYPASGQSQSTFTTAGIYNIPAALTGEGFFVFEYTGSTTVTTTIQLDDIEVR